MGASRSDRFGRRGLGSSEHRLGLTSRARRSVGVSAVTLRVAMPADALTAAEPIDYDEAFAAATLADFDNIAFREAMWSIAASSRRNC